MDEGLAKKAAWRREAGSRTPLPSPPADLYKSFKWQDTQHGKYPYYSSAAYKGYYHRFDPQYHYPVTYEVYTFDAFGLINPIYDNAIAGRMQYCITSFTPLE
jgi:hypothetical protein